MKKILVPCDFSPASKKAYQYALEIASAAGGTVLVLHITKPATLYLKILNRYLHAADGSGAKRQLSQAVKGRFAKFSHHIDTQNVPVHFFSKHGKLDQTLAKEAIEQHADLVVMGTRGANGFKELVFGSNTEKIIRTAPVPVLVIHEFTPLSKVKHIVFPTTLELTDKNQLDKLKELQQFFKAKLHILYVKTPSEAASEQQIRRRMQTYVSFYGLENCLSHTRTNVSEANAIVSFSAGLAGSMIAMGTRAQKGLNHFILGSITEDVVNHAARNVWTYALQGQTETPVSSQRKASSGSPRNKPSKMSSAPL